LGFHVLLKFIILIIPPTTVTSKRDYVGFQHQYTSSLAVPPPDI